MSTLRERLEGLRQSWDDLADDTYGPHSFDFRCGVQRCEAELGLLIKALAAEGQGAPATNRTTLDECFGDPFIWCEGMDHSEALQGNDWILIKASALRALAAAPSLHKEGAGGATIAQKLQGVVNKWLVEAERLHNLTPDERERDSRRNGLLEAVADVVAFTAEHDCGVASPAGRAEQEPP